MAGGQLAAALLAAGQPAEAVTWFRWLASSLASMSGLDHPGTIAARVSLGRALMAAGQPDQALAALDEAAARSERAMRARRCRHHGRAGGIRRRVAGRGQDRRGDPAVQAAAGRPRARCTGPDTPAPRPSGCGWPGPCWPRARPRTPSPSTRPCWPTGSSALGPDHPDTLAACAGLAAACDAAGQMGAALQYHQEACDGYERVYGADHPDTLARRAYLARAYAAAGQLGEAVTLLRDTIARSEQALSPGDPLTVALRQALAEITGEMTAW